MKTNYQNLKVWQESIEFVKGIYNITDKFPQKEQFSLVSQIRRAAVSVPSNIAEGDQRNTKKENINFLYYAKGSAAEVETQLIISLKLGYISQEPFDILDDKVNKILRMLSSLIKYKSSS